MTKRQDGSTNKYHHNELFQHKVEQISLAEKEKQNAAKILAFKKQF